MVSPKETEDEESSRVSFRGSHHSRRTSAIFMPEVHQKVISFTGDEKNALGEDDKIVTSRLPLIIHHDGKK